MAANKKPRKKYRPKYTTDPIRHMSRLSRHEQLSVLITAHDSLLRITRGNGVLEDWRVVAGSLNMAVSLDRLVFHSAHAELLRESILAHARCGVRGRNLGKFGYSGEDLKTVNAAMAIHDAQMELATPREICLALEDNERRDQRKEGVVNVAEMALSQGGQHETI